MNGFQINQPLEKGDLDVGRKQIIETPMDSRFLSQTPRHSEYHATIVDDARRIESATHRHTSTSVNCTLMIHFNPGSR